MSRPLKGSAPMPNFVARVTPETQARLDAEKARSGETWDTLLSRLLWYSGLVAEGKMEMVVDD